MKISRKSHQLKPKVGKEPDTQTSLSLRREKVQHTQAAKQKWSAESHDERQSETGVTHDTLQS